MDDDSIIDAPLISYKRKPFVLIKIGVSLILMGGLIGATTNSINGLISEQYFRDVMNWNFDGIWLAAIFQGIIEGLAYGLIFSFIYIIAFILITKICGDWRFAKGQIIKAIPIIYISWFLGGLVSITLALLFVEEYNELILGMPDDNFNRVTYAWVGGSIWGEIIGGLIGIFYVIILTYQNWYEEIRKVKNHARFEI